MDLFDNADYVITGKHGDMLRQLVSTWKIFPTYVSVLPIAAVVGVLMKRLSDRDDSTDSGPKIPFSTLANNDALINKAFQLVIMNTPRILDEEDRVNRLFRREKVQKEDRELFDSYVRGGIEYLNEAISADAADTDSDRMINITKIVDEVYDKNSKVTAESILELIQKQ